MVSGNQVGFRHLRAALQGQKYTPIIMWPSLRFQRDQMNSLRNSRDSDIKQIENAFKDPEDRQFYLRHLVYLNRLLPPHGFGPGAKTRGGIIVSPALAAYTYKECVKYWCSMRINPDFMKLGAYGGLG